MEIRVSIDFFGYVHLKPKGAVAYALGEDFGSEAPFGLRLPERWAELDATLGGGGAILGAEGDTAGAAMDVVDAEEMSEANDGLSCGAGEGAMAIAALIMSRRVGRMWRASCCSTAWRLVEY